MQVASAQFFEEISGSHTVFSYVDVLGPDNKVIRIDATDGNVNVDRTATYRRQCNITCVDPTGVITPKSEDDVLTPYGTEIRPYRGVRYAGGTVEVVPLGVFRLSKVTVTDASSSAATSGIVLEGYDRSRTVERDKFIAPYTVAVGTNIVQAIKDILARTFSDLTYDTVATNLTATAPMVFDVNISPWQAATTLAEAIGCEVFFDANGDVVIAPPVDVDHLPAADWTYIEGNGCQMLALGVVYTDEPGTNGVVLTGESTGSETAPVRSVVWDNVPSSPTYHLGPYGEVPAFVTNSVVVTQADADSVAAATLNSMIGVTSQLAITSMVNPALDTNDTVDVQRSQEGIAAKYAIDSLVIPLMAATTATVNLRAKRVISQ